jgi:hypothetical protein
VDQQLGRINLVRWQGRRDRRINAGVRPWTVFIIGCAVLGGAAMALEAFGWLSLSGPLAVLPPALILVAVSAQLVAIVRALLTWLAG